MPARRNWPRAVEVGFDDYVAKYDREGLVHTLNEALSEVRGAAVSGMSNGAGSRFRHSTWLTSSGEQRDYVTMSIGDQMFGIPVLTVQDVLGPQNIARVPLAPPEVAGSLNLRGRIVTAIDVRPRLGLRDPRRRQGGDVGGGRA